jgi:redox-sensing transcriptional repressor
MDVINEKTIERMCVYRRLLKQMEKEGVWYAYSHDLAAVANVSAVQVRRDLMYIGYAGSNRKGYEIKGLMTSLDEILDPPHKIRIAIVGVGNVGKALINFFTDKSSKREITALFDIDPDLVNRTYNGIPCYPVEQLKEIIIQEQIDIGIIASPTRTAKTVASEMAAGGIKSVVNFTNTPLTLSDHIFLEQIDITTSIEKASYFTKVIESQRRLTPSKTTVLIIDDDYDIAQSYKAILDTNGYTTDYASHSEEGLSKILNTSPDLIILDIMMEKADSGFLLLNELKERKIKTPVILCSSIARATANILDVTQLNIRSILQKPVDLDELLNILKGLR